MQICVGQKYQKLAKTKKTLTGIEKRIYDEILELKGKQHRTIWRVSQIALNFFTVFLERLSVI